MNEKEYIASRINKICNKAACFVCDEADKYESYEQCPYLPLKQIARERPVTADDVPDELVKR